MSSFRSRTEESTMSIAEGKRASNRLGSCAWADFKVSAARPTGVSGFLISWMTRSTASFQASRRWVARIWVRSSHTTTVPWPPPSPGSAEATTDSVEALVGLVSRSAALRELAVQWGYVGIFFAVSLLVWHTGVRRFAAYGG